MYTMYTHIILAMLVWLAGRSINRAGERRRKLDPELVYTDAKTVTNFAFTSISSAYASFVTYFAYNFAYVLVWEIFALPCHYIVPMYAILATMARNSNLGSYDTALVYTSTTKIPHCTT